MTIKDKRDAVVTAARNHVHTGVNTVHVQLRDKELASAVAELEAAETPLKLEGVVHVFSYGDIEDPEVEFRGQMESGAATIIIKSVGVLDMFRSRETTSRFRIVLTEIMDDAS